jgi:hypothetical protein
MDLAKSFENFQKGIHILGAISDIGDLWEEAKASILASVWKHLILALRDGFEGFKTSAEEGTTDVARTVRELDLEVEPETPFQDKISTDEELFLCG